MTDRRKIINPQTGNKVYADGALGKKILAARKATRAKISSKKSVSLVANQEKDIVREERVLKHVDQNQTVHGEKRAKHVFDEKEFVKEPCTKDQCSKETINQLLKKLF